MHEKRTVVRPDRAAAGPPPARDPGGARRRRELASLNAVAETLNRTDDLSVALTRVLTIVAEVLGLRSGWVWLLNERGEYVPAAGYRLPPHLQDPSHMTGWLCHCLETFAAGDLRGAANVNVLSCTRLWNVIDGNDGLRYHASIPIYLGERKIGVMNVAMPEWRELSVEELQFLYTVGYQVGLAVEHRRLLTAQTRLAQVEERNRLAREIHDTVAQTLAGLALQLEAADALIERDTVRSHHAVGRAINLTHTALEDVRRSVLDLRAAPLEGLTLAEALRRRVAAFAAEHAITGTFALTGADRPLPPRLEVGVFRIAQEALTNVARHAAATSVSVLLSVDEAPGGRLRLSVEDDGRGFDAEAPPGHFGLVGMRERARLLGGGLQIASTPDAGTRVELDLPLEG
ncbi:MAG: GAF domain-containing sensor histidine kinase [Dehalococcoidia bacterium]